MCVSTLNYTKTFPVTLKFSWVMRRERSLRTPSAKKCIGSVKITICRKYESLMYQILQFF